MPEDMSDNEIDAWNEGAWRDDVDEWGAEEPELDEDGDFSFCWGFN
jgi:hypothetical protein